MWPWHIFAMAATCWPRELKRISWIAGISPSAKWRLREYRLQRGCRRLCSSRNPAHWWEEMGKTRDSSVIKLIIKADCWGINGTDPGFDRLAFRALQMRPVWKSWFSFLSGNLEWEKVGHLFFVQMSRGWRGQPPETLEIIVLLIAATSADTGYYSSVTYRRQRVSKKYHCSQWENEGCRCMIRPQEHR